MIFRPDMVNLIRNGRKTEARYPIAKSLKVQPHKHYAAQPDRDKAPCRIWITDVYVQLFDDLEHQDVMRDGFHDLEQFLEHWKERFRQDIDWGHRMRVVRFELYKGQDKVPKPPRDVVRSLRVAMDPGQPAQEGFAERRRAPEPEPVDPAIVERLPARLEAQQRWIKDRMHREAALYQGSVTERLDRALADARANRIDTSSIERLIARKVTELERRNDRAA